MKKNRMPISQPLKPDSPSLHYQLGMWYRSKGLIKEASACLKDALIAVRQASSDSDQGIEAFDEAQGWLQYGKLMLIQGNVQEASAAFMECILLGRYEVEALVEWGTILHDSEISDREIADTLLRACTPYLDKPSRTVAQALYILGAYAEAVDIFTTERSNNVIEVEQYIPYVNCLLHLGKWNEALKILLEQMDDPEQILLRAGNHFVRVLDATYLCRWFLDEGRFTSPLTRYEAMETAKSAIVFGKVEDALQWIPDPTYHEVGELIYTLYEQGYRERAAAWLSQLKSLPFHDRNVTSLQLCFVAAEIYYDHGKFEEAAAIFEKIYTTDPCHTPSRFGAASCYLQQSISSLKSKQERALLESDSFLKISHYLSNLKRALQILDISKWHTEWTPAQRRKLSSPSSILLH